MRLHLLLLPLPQPARRHHPPCCRPCFAEGDPSGSKQYKKETKINPSDWRDVYTTPRACAVAEEKIRTLCPDPGRLSENCGKMDQWTLQLIVGSYFVSPSIVKFTSDRRFRTRQRLYRYERTAHCYSGVLSTISRCYVLNRRGTMPRYFTAQHAFTRDPNEEGKYHDERSRHSFDYYKKPGAPPP